MSIYREILRLLIEKEKVSRERAIAVILEYRVFLAKIRRDSCAEDMALNLAFYA